MNNTGQNGEKMRFYSDLLQGKVVIINSFFGTCQGVCLPMNRNLEKVQEALGRITDATSGHSGWSNKVAPTPTEVQPAVVKVKTCEIKQSAPAVELPWLTESVSEPIEVERPAVSELFQNLLIVKNRKHNFIRISPRDREMLLKLNRSINLRIAS